MRQSSMLVHSSCEDAHLVCDCSSFQLYTSKDSAMAHLVVCLLLQMMHAFIG